MKLVSVVGARPQFVKLAPLSRALAGDRERRPTERAIDHRIIHTGQHYDDGMSDVFFRELEIPPPDENLGIGSGRHGAQTGRMLERLESVLLASRPDLVIVYGDTNSTLAGALAAAKLEVPIAHVEAGLRSGNRRMPEELNRVLTDHAADLLLAPTPTGMENLKREGLGERAVFTGDLMHDLVLWQRRRTGGPSAARRLGLEPGAYGVVTIHRAENTGDPARFARILEALAAVAGDGLRLVFPVHPRTRPLLEEAARAGSAGSTGSGRGGAGGTAGIPGLVAIEPLGPLEMLSLVGEARVILTDSGGLQKEAFFLGCPCVTLRDETEWRETVEGGGNVVAGVEPERVRAAARTFAERYPHGGADFSAAARAGFGGGDAAARIRTAIEDFLGQRIAGGRSGRP